MVIFKIFAEHRNRVVMGNFQVFRRFIQLTGQCRTNKSKCLVKASRNKEHRDLIHLKLTEILLKPKNKHHRRFHRVRIDQKH